MSWLFGTSTAGATDNEPKVADPAFKGRMVSTKTPNKPYLSYKQYRERQEAEHAAWLARQKEREEKLARGEDAGPAEPDPTEEQEVGCVGLTKLLLVLLLLAALAGKFFTGSFTWEYGASLKQFWPTNDTLYSEKMLAKFDGSDPTKPMYLGIDGDVYDVSSNRRTYGPGTGYHVFVGKDAARAFVTGCFKEHQTHDLRGLTEQEMGSLNHWKKFFADHKDYPRVGRVAHAPIDPSSPIPAPCKQPGEEDAGKAKAQTQEKKKQRVYGPQRKDEL